MSASIKDLIYILVGLRTHYIDFTHVPQLLGMSLNKQQIKMQLYVKSICGTPCSLSAVSLHFLSLSPVARHGT
jgi:hypothetical protein